MAGATNYGLNTLYLKPAQLAGAGGAALLQTITVTSGAANNFAAFDINTSAIFIDIQGGDVYATSDGSTPSSSNGHRLLVGEKYTWARATAQAFKFIAVGTTATLTGSPFSV
jgi:hypothetical protein